MKQLHFIIVVMVLLLGHATADTLCSSKEGYTFKGAKIKTIDVENEDCFESACKAACRGNDRCRKWSLMTYARFGRSATCTLHTGSAVLTKKSAMFSTFYAGVCK